MLFYAKMNTKCFGFICLILCILPAKTNAKTTCLACKDSVIPSTCDTVDRCGDFESCFIDTYVTSLGYVRYDLGCRDTQQCQGNMRNSSKRSSSTDRLIDSECCTSDLCNAKSKFKEGFPQTRGPICFNCPSQINNKDCNRIKMCSQNELCVLRPDTTNPGLFQTTCERQEVCSPFMSTDIVGKKRAYDLRQIKERDSSYCYACCDTDLCNDKCGTSGPAQNLCAYHPCVGGTCVGNITGYTCNCKTGYTGTHCEIAVHHDPCLSNPCVFGVCINHGTYYACNCLPGHTGVNCEQTYISSKQPTSAPHITHAMTSVKAPTKPSTTHKVTTHTTTTTHKTTTKAAYTGNCQDAVNYCANYARSYCTDSANKAWMTKNCAQYCGVCGDTCEDAVNYCSNYALSYCTDNSNKAWMTKNCARYCDACPDSCRDEVNYCSTYQMSYCTDSSNKVWMTQNCAKYCGLCGTSNSHPMTTAKTTTRTTTHQSSNCYDRLTNCADYRMYCDVPAHVEWAKYSCRKYCNKCSCEDRITNCASYSKECYSAQFGDWMSLNCPKYCGKCFFVYLLINFLCTYLGIKGSLTCLSCNDAVVPADCNTVARCGQHETCFTDTYITTFGTIRYDLGCMDAVQCSGPIRNSTSIRRASSSAQLIDSQCCKGNLCNVDTKQYGGYPQERGPICYTCHSQAHHADCNKISVCGRDEFCVIKPNLLHPGFFRTECIRKEMCKTNTAFALFGRKRSEARSVDPACFECCSENLCNDKCNTTITQSHPCYLRPCVSGTCKEDGTSYTCICDAGYTGTHCQIAIEQDPCLSNPCAYGTCINHGNYYACICSPGYTGMNCDQAHYEIPTTPTLPTTTTVQITPTPKPHHNVHTPKCHYKGHTYNQGEHWQDGCAFSCVCGSNSRYRCTPLCPIWNLPRYCYMMPPRPGKCCPDPRCPAGFIINYPDGYKPGAV